MDGVTRSAGQTHTTVVIGAGNGYRSDDGAGLVVVQRLRERVPNGVNVRSVHGEATEVMTAWRGFHTAIVVDAVSSGAQAGRVHRFDAIERPLPTEFFRFSTHGFGVVDAIELGRALGTLPSRILVYGIEGADFGAGTEITPQVAEAIDAVVTRIVQDVGKDGRYA